MSTRTNANGVRETLHNCLVGDATALKDIGILLDFARFSTTGDPFGLLGGIALITKAAGAAISAAVGLRTHCFPKDHGAGPLDAVPKYDRFRALYYVTALRSYIECIPDLVKKVRQPKLEDGKKSHPHPSEKDIQELRKRLEGRLAALDEAEVSFLFCIDPMAGYVPLFSAIGEWLSATLAFYGYPEAVTRDLIGKCEESAKQRFKVILAEDSPDSAWMRNYLALLWGEKDITRIATDLSSIRHTLENWVSPAAAMQERVAKAWQAYRDELKHLPDQKDTMYNENFGVRRVFLEPLANYHVVGAAGTAGKPQQVPKLGRLLGALVSNRLPEDDIVVLCGGPGCGKSTLCRVLASQLAEDNRMHPVFLRLRRLKEGSDVALFVEESLQKLGVLNRLADLRGMSNLVLILDGFDELVMASRARLRHFFNMLREEHAAGPLREARIIVSGRDTLFPGGEGLPTGCHVVSLLPFDKQRVAAWGAKWRSMHEGGAGSTFKPESLLNGTGTATGSPPLYHLVTWPLTLHLVARVHTAGRLNLAGRESREIEKAYLYRSILAETADRQLGQATGKGRLNPQQMREFLRSLAWEMYSRSTDTMEHSEVLPILGCFYPEASETDMAELADVAIVNSPELAKGEQTGFEFVHKSFSEYLVAERMAFCIERVIFKAAEFGSDELTWRMTADEATAELAPVLGVRLLTDEVQEMLEPMLGCLAEFSKGGRADELVSSRARKEGLIRVIERCELLLKELLQGKSLDVINRETHGRLLLKSPLEAYANQCAGYLLLGCAAARQLLSSSDKDRTEQRFFNGEMYEGAFWQCLCLLHAGGLHTDAKLAKRLFAGLSVRRPGRDRPMDDTSVPIRLASLAQIDGYRPLISMAVSELLQYVAYSRLREQLVMYLLAAAFKGPLPHFRVNPFDMDAPFGVSWRHRPREIAMPLEIFEEAGLVDRDSLQKQLEERDYGRYREYMHRLEKGMADMDLPRALEFLVRDMEGRPLSAKDDLGRFLEYIIRSILSEEPSSSPPFRDLWRRLRGKAE